MPRTFKITVNGTEYDVAVEELTDGATQIMPRYTPAPVAAVSAAPAAVAVPKAAPAAVGGGAQRQCRRKRYPQSGWRQSVGRRDAPRPRQFEFSAGWFVHLRAGTRLRRPG